MSLPSNRHSDWLFLFRETIVSAVRVSEHPFQVCYRKEAPKKKADVILDIHPDTATLSTPQEDDRETDEESWTPDDDDESLSGSPNVAIPEESDDDNASVNTGGSTNSTSLQTTPSVIFRMRPMEVV